MRKSYIITIFILVISSCTTLNTRDSHENSYILSIKDAYYISLNISPFTHPFEQHKVSWNVNIIENDEKEYTLTMENISRNIKENDIPHELNNIHNDLLNIPIQSRSSLSLIENISISFMYNNNDIEILQLDDNSSKVIQKIGEESLKHLLMLFLNLNGNKIYPFANFDNKNFINFKKDFLESINLNEDNTDFMVTTGIWSEIIKSNRSIFIGKFIGSTKSFGHVIDNGNNISIGIRQGVIINEKYISE
ncbi:MAG: hypothetical protein OCD02_00205 [Spirochaetaceae bacterium]